MDFHIPKIWQILKHFSNKKISFLKSGYWIVVLLILDLTKKNEQVMRKRQKKGRDLWNTNVYCSTDLSMQIKKYIYIAQVTL